MTSTLVTSTPLTGLADLSPTFPGRGRARFLVRAAGVNRVGRGRRLIRSTASLLVLAATLTACGGSSSEGPGSNPPAADGPVLLRAPAGTDRATIESAATGVRARLVRMGVPSPTVTATSDGVQVSSSADRYQLQAAARAAATTVVAVVSAALGPCAGPGLPSAGPSTRCYQVGPRLTGVDAVAKATVALGNGAGWGVSFSIDPAKYQAFRAALGVAAGRLAVVAGAKVLLAFNAGTPALNSTLGPPLAEEEARAVAAALTVDSDLPVALEAPPLPDPPLARVDQDFWTAALGVRICGTWLANAPSWGLETGLHSHGDGLVYVHPFTADEAGTKATLGLFLKRGGWKLDATSLELWDRVEHRNGSSCPGGAAARVRWWVDGVEGQGAAAAYTPRNGQVVVITFDDRAEPPGEPPQMAAIIAPTMRASS